MFMLFWPCENCHSSHVMTVAMFPSTLGFSWRLWLPSPIRFDLYLTNLNWTLHFWQNYKVLLSVGKSFGQRVFFFSYSHPSWRPLSACPIWPGSSPGLLLSSWPGLPFSFLLRVLDWSLIFGLLLYLVKPLENGTRERVLRPRMSKNAFLAYTLDWQLD